MRWLSTANKLCCVACSIKFFACQRVVANYKTDVAQSSGSYSALKYMAGQLYRRQVIHGFSPTMPQYAAYGSSGISQRMGLRTLGWAQRIPNQTSWSSSIMPLGGPSPSCESRTSAYNRATRCRELEHERHVNRTISRCRIWQRRERYLNCRDSATKESASNDNAVIVGKRAQVAAFWPVEGAYLHCDNRIWRDPA